MLRADVVAPVVLHVHDEIVCESPTDAREELENLLNTPPSWAPGLPMKIEVFVSDVYSKESVTL